MAEVVDDLERDEEARLRDELAPLEDALVDDAQALGVLGVAARRGTLQPRQLRRYLDDGVARAGVDVGVGGADVVEDVEGEGGVAGAELEDDEVAVGVEGDLVVGHEVAGHCLRVVGPEELRRGVPELAGIIGAVGVETVLEGDVALRE